jgi:hypothetical protein
MKHIFILSVPFMLFSCTQDTEVKIDEKKAEATEISSREVGLIDYEKSNEYDTRIAYNDSFFVVLNFEVGHADFYAAQSTLHQLREGKIMDLNHASSTHNAQKFTALVDSLSLTELDVCGFLSHNQKTSKIDTCIYDNAQTKAHVGSVHFSIDYSSKGITTLLIKSPKTNYKKVISRDLTPSFPRIVMMDITGDNVSELFILFPCSDYWDSRCFRLKIYDVHDFI